MMPFAGSAIGQDAGKLSNFESWKPGRQRSKWLLLAGASEPPCQISQRRSDIAVDHKGDNFLHGVTNDLATMENSPVVHRDLHNVVRNFYLEKEDAVKEIKKLFSACRGENCKPILYYTGHGEVGTGNWAFQDGTISVEEIRTIKEEMEVDADAFSYPLIVSDACFSGWWANYCHNIKLEGFECLAASPEFSPALDTGG